jgi:hypothetical protein
MPRIEGDKSGKTEGRKIVSGRLLHISNSATGEKGVIPRTERNAVMLGQ